MHFFCSSEFLLINIQSALCSTVSRSRNSTNHRLKYLEEKLQRVPNSKTWIFLMQATVYLAFTLYSQRCIYSVLGIISNLQMTQSRWGNVHGLYISTIPFYMRDRHPLILVSTGCPGTSPFWMARDDCIHPKVKAQMHTAYIHSLCLPEGNYLKLE